MGQSETQTVTYRMMGSSRGEETVTVTPFYSSLKLEVNDKVAWTSGTSTGAPPVIHLREGETAQSKVSSWQSPNPGFFQGIDIPENILDPDKKNGLGVTKVSSRGLEPQ